MKDADLEKIASALGMFITGWRDETGHYGSIDLVCHSVGTCIARYLLEVCDGTARRERVRQLIGLGPPNNGSALAELFHDPEHGPGIIDNLTGIFLPKGFDPGADPIVQDVRPASIPMQKLRNAGIRPDITYRIIVTANPGGLSDFFPMFQGKTWEMTKARGYQQTWDGDGIVAHAESALPGVSLDVITASTRGRDPLLHPNQFCHLHLPKNTRVNDRIMQYLTDPSQG
jgi:hypothetical protein